MAMRRTVPFAPLLTMVFLFLGSPVVAEQGAMPVRAQLDHRTAHAVSGRFVGIDLLTDRRETVAIGFVIDHRYIYDTRATLPRSDDAGLRKEINAIGDTLYQEYRDKVLDSLRVFVRDYTARLSTGVSAEILPREDGYSIAMHGPGRDKDRETEDFERIAGAVEAEKERLWSAALPGIRQRHLDLSRDVYARYAFTLEERPEGRSLLPDYAAIARRDVEAVSDLAQAIRALAGSDGSESPATRDRDAVAFTVGLLQTIPYDLLQDRSTTARDGLVRPVDLFLGNRGDCDTKGTAFGSLMATLVPDRRAVQVLIDGHAVVGVELAPRPGDTALSYDGRIYVLAEVAGPAIIPLGQLATASRREIELGRIHKVIEF